MIAVSANTLAALNSLTRSSALRAKGLRIGLEVEEGISTSERANLAVLLLLHWEGEGVSKGKVDEG